MQKPEIPPPMRMVRREYFLDNAFWRDDNREHVTCMHMTEYEDGGKNHVVLELDRVTNGEEDELFKQLLGEIPVETIDRNTMERRQRKIEEGALDVGNKDRQNRAGELESLFNIKLQAFEMEEVRNSTNRKLRSKIRSAKNAVELNAYLSVLVMDYYNEQSTAE
jgi:hypothetical protein